MKRFLYQGRNGKGHRCDGEVLADDLRQATYRVQSLGITLLSLKLAPNARLTWSLIDRYRCLPIPVLALFCRQFHSLMKAGIPLMRAINGLAQSCDHLLLKKALLSMQPALMDGVSLSTAMSAYPRLFPPLFLAMIQVGENTGRLDRCLWQLAHYYDQDSNTTRQVRAALRYPSFVFMALVMAMGVIHIKVIPPFARLFERFDVPLPWPTQLLMSVSNGLLDYGVTIFLISFVLIVGFLTWRHTDSGKLIWKKSRLRWPVFGSLWHRALLGRFSHALALMLRAGVPMHQALLLSNHVVDNRYLQTQLTTLRQGVEQGQSLTQMSQQLAIFPPLVQQMLAVGEETGQLDDLLLEIADFYDKEVTYQLASLTAKLEPILLLLVSLLVLLLAMGIFLPMWNLLDLAKTF